MPHYPQRLLVIQRADALGIALHRLARKHARELSDLSPGLRGQLLRAAVSVSANLAEACGQSTPRKTAAQIDVAIGSLNEVERMLVLMEQLGSFGEVTRALIRDVQETRSMAYGFRKRVLSIESPGI